MTGSEVGARTAERLRRSLNVDLAELVRQERIDMSAEAITQRVREAADLSTLCLALGEIRQ